MEVIAKQISDLKEQLAQLGVKIATKEPAQNLTPLKALISTGNGKVTASAISSAKLDHLANVTGDIQDQFNQFGIGLETKEPKHNFIANKALVSSVDGKVIES